MSVRALYEAIDRLIPFAGAGAWDQVGLQVGDWDQAAARVAVAHEITDSVVDQVLAEDISTVVTYHPLLFTPTTAFVSGPTGQGRAHRLAANSVAVISVHTAFDVASPGTGDALVAALGLSTTGSFGPVDDEGGADIGRTAELPTGQTVDDLVSAVSAVTGSEPRSNSVGDRPVTTVGVVPGSGGSFLDAAVGMVDAVVTGDVSHHEAQAARSTGLVVIDAGHIGTERAGVEALYAAVCKVEPEATHIAVDPSPWEG